MSVLYIDDDWLAEIECQSAFVDGRCPHDDVAVYVFGREHRISHELMERFRAEIRKHTHDCVDLRHLNFVDQTRKLFHFKHFFLLFFCLNLFLSCRVKKAGRPI